MVRTDRDSKLFCSGGYTEQLLDVLVSFAVFDPSCAYSQGMSDMLSPLLVVMEDEVPSVLVAAVLMAAGSVVLDVFSADGSVPRAL